MTSFNLDPHHAAIIILVFENVTDVFAAVVGSITVLDVIVIVDVWLLFFSLLLTSKVILVLP